MTKDKGPPGGSRPPSEHSKKALGERGHYSAARSPEQTLTAAARYEFLGYRVIALHPGTRHPCYRGWTSPDTTRPIRAQLAQHPDADLAVVTGDGFFVLDVDTVEGHGRAGFASLAALEARHGKLPPTRTARTPSGGVHYHFRSPDSGPLPNSTSKVGDGLDIRGDRGFAKVPSTLQMDGDGRVWIDGGKLAEAPPWLVDLVRSRGRPVIKIDPALADAMATDGRNGRSTDPYDLPKPRTFEEDDKRLKLEWALLTIPADDYDLWLKIGMGIYAELGDDGFDLFDEWSSSAQKQYDSEAVREKWVECAKVRDITVASVYDEANLRDPGKLWLKRYRKAKRGRAAR
ncbi:MAG: bifunctional DNA primase/polymerase [Xanthobacteraceae bacterium]|nr:bifunctional DNA primase/polymerase [Xanthobacteraceae bacterium]